MHRHMHRHCLAGVVSTASRAGAAQKRWTLFITVDLGSAAQHSAPTNGGSGPQAPYAITAVRYPPVATYENFTEGLFMMMEGQRILPSVTA